MRGSHRGPTLTGPVDRENQYQQPERGNSSPELLRHRATGFGGLGACRVIGQRECTLQLVRLVACLIDGRHRLAQVQGAGRHRDTRGQARRIH
jgi:hypothetical protein